MAPKSKTQKMSLGAFLEDQSLGSWADEMEDVPVASESRTGYGNDRRVFTQPPYPERSFDRASERFTPREQLPLPSKPPYTAHLGNLPFDATQGDVEEYFQGCEPTNVRIVEDKIEHKPKGFGYVEFRSLDGLKKALTLDGTQFRGRNIRISVAEPPKDRPEARELNDWTRKGPLPDLPQQRRASDSRGFKGYEAAPEMERGGSRRGAPSFDGDGKVRDFNNWERKGPLTPLSPPAGGPPVREGGRARDGPQRERKLSPSWGDGRDGSRPPRGEFRERPQVDRQPTPAELDNQWRARMRPDPPAKSSNTPTPEPSAPSSPAQPPAPAVRPKLNLQKRTVAEAEPTAAAAAAASTSTDSKSSPFGAARPIDTAAREREVEEKRQLQIRLKKEAEEKAREEKKAKEAAAKAADQISSPVQENGKPHEEPNENGTSAPVPGRSYQILSRIDDEGNEIENEKDAAAADEPPNGEIVDDKPAKPREFIREPPKGPKAQQHGGPWRRKPSASNAPTSPSGPTAVGLEEEGWSTVPTRGKGGRGRGGNAGARAIAS